jgi:predicted secreted acid phosphatase
MAKEKLPAERPILQFLNPLSQPIRSQDLNSVVMISCTLNTKNAKYHKTQSAVSQIVSSSLWVQIVGEEKMIATIDHDVARMESV